MKVLFVIAPQNFRDEEYFHPKEELEKAGIEVVTASKSTETATGMRGGTVDPDMSLRDVNVADYDAVAFIGGGGSSIYFNNPAAQDIAKKANSAGKVVAAICIAPTILANAGLLKGKRATAFSSEGQSLQLRGAEYTGEALTEDGNIITADGPASAREFGRAIARALK